MAEQIRLIDHDSPRDRRIVIDLLSERLGLVRSTQDPESRYRWLYNGNPHGQSHTLVSFDGRSQKPIGMLSLFPRKVLVDGELRRGASLGDEHHRAPANGGPRKSFLHSEAMKLVASSSIDLVFGGVSEPSRAVAMHGSRTASLGEVDRHVRFLRCRPSRSKLVGRAARTVDSLLRPARSSIEAVIVDDGVDRRIGTAFWRMASTQPPRRIVAVRDAEYVAWRYGRCPTPTVHAYLLRHRGTPIGFAAIERGVGRARVLDLWAAPEHSSAALLAIMRLAQPAHTIEYDHLTSPGASRAQLWSLGFARIGRTRPLWVRTPTHGPIHDLDHKGREWLYARGDVDFGADSESASVTMRASTRTGGRRVEPPPLPARITPRTPAAAAADARG